MEKHKNVYSTNYKWILCQYTLKTSDIFRFFIAGIVFGSFGNAVLFSGRGSGSCFEVEMVCDFGVKLLIHTVEVHAMEHKLKGYTANCIVMDIRNAYPLAL